MFTYFIKIWKKDYHILTMKKREVWTDRGLQNRVADAALFPTLYSPSSWALSRDHRPPQDWPNFGGLWRHKFLAHDSSRSPWDPYLSPLTSPSRPSSTLAAVRERRSSSGREQRSSSGRNEVGTTTLLCCQFIFNLYRRSSPWRQNGLLFDLGLVLWEVMWGIMTSIFVFLLFIFSSTLC